ncbi:MAG: caspase family protein [Candidatus Parabeggiatoa sp.]|nr:caspase family protein [Candidatus Parabeggiatoa sp.]
MYRYIILFLSLIISITGCSQSDTEQSKGVGSSTPSTAINHSTSSTQTARIALVIGNGNYDEKFNKLQLEKLRNPVNDAIDVANALKHLGFQVILKTNVRKKTAMKQAVRDFTQRLGQQDVGMFYFSGHGFQQNNINYLVPLRADIHDDIDIEGEALPAKYVLNQMERATRGVKLMILDACRESIPDDFFRKSKGAFAGVSKGFSSSLNAPMNTLIIYATAANKVSWGGLPGERNSVYTKHLVDVLRQKPHTMVETLLKEVRYRVVQETEDTEEQQVPWESGSLITQQFCFGSCGSEEQKELEQQRAELEQQRLQLERQRAQLEREKARQKEKTRFVEEAKPIEKPAPPPSLTSPPPEIRLLDILPKASTESAFTMLFNLWGLDYTSLAGNKACQRATTQGLACLLRTGTWDELRYFNRPAVIELVTADGKQHHMVVTHLQNNTAILAIGKDIYEFSLHEINKYWLGQFLLLWHPPMLPLPVLKKGTSHKAVIWVRKHLDIIDGLNSKPHALSPRFNSTLKQRIIAFQRQHKLEPDGVVGEKTMLALQALAGEGPRLEKVLEARLSTLSSSNRYTDNSDGTVTDNRSGLIWLKNANCFGKQNWKTAKRSAAKLAHGHCGLRDGSRVGMWRLPTKNEWEAMIDKKYKWTESDTFSSVRTFYYWSSTTSVDITPNAWHVYLGDGGVFTYYERSTCYVWPVRSGV